MKAPTMYEREQEAMRRVLQLLAQLRAPWRAHGVSVRRFDVSVKQLRSALNVHGQEAILTRAYTKIDFLLKTAVKRSGLSLAESLDLDALSCEVVALREGRALSVPKRNQAQADARQFLKSKC